MGIAVAGSSAGSRVAIAMTFVSVGLYGAVVEDQPEGVALVDLGKHGSGVGCRSCCWCGYPRRCECGGLVHGEDEGKGATRGNGTPHGVTHRETCDRCGKSWRIKIGLGKTHVNQLKKGENNR